MKLWRGLMAIKNEISKIPQREKAETPGQKTQGKKDDTKQYSFRMKVSDIEILTKHFDENGLLFSQGLRKVIREYIKNNNL
jgi:hypothetical protein